MTRGIGRLGSPWSANVFGVLSAVRAILKKREGSWDGRCHFEPWSDDKDGTLAGTLSKLPHHTSGGTLGTADLLENRVSSLEPSGPETETLSLCR
ncbi:hypothetical protein AVEN_166354-1 [Araneus ventricosus]|uniref:Uncharacterized protein n=1 Tax=Araneus ventricosus TaxID=182803 RepID=A0A4Y2API2_ARAVE|nr:hypothetical protein AVEN_165609-1 [Araneus ventricosus]GBL80918.1 hypothetical protein AVEN_166354-1 [Araneus ventricosus]